MNINIALIVLTYTPMDRTVTSPKIMLAVGGLSKKRDTVVLRLPPQEHQYCLWTYGSYLGITHVSGTDR